MKAAVLTSYDGPQAITILNDRPIPEPAAGEVQVRVEAASINPFDVKVAEGAVRQMAELEFPAVLGGDFSGIVTKLGEGVTGIAVGDEVYGQAGALSSHGSFAEYTVVKAEQLALKPRTLDFQQAAALPLTATSAYQALVDHMQLQAGQKILIHGGAGGIGSMAIQIAKHRGAYVAATANTANLAYIAELGADESIDYTNEDFTEQVADYDAVYDTIGGETYTKSFTVLKPGGVLVSMVEQSNEELMARYQVRVVPQFTHCTTERLTRVAELVDAGALAAHIDKTFTLERLADAFVYYKDKHPRGKIVIRLAWVY